MYVAAPRSSVSAARSRSRLCSSKNPSIGRAMTFPPGPSQYPSSDMMLHTIKLRMVHLLRLVLELSPDERHSRRRIHRSGRENSMGTGKWRNSWGSTKPAIHEIRPSRRLSTLTAPSRNQLTLVAGERRLPVRRDRHQPP